MFNPAGPGQQRSQQVEESNWLPAPDGPFYMVLRLYLPKAFASPCPRKRSWGREFEFWRSPLILPFDLFWRVLVDKRNWVPDQPLKRGIFLCWAFLGGGLPLFPVAQMG